MLRKPSTHRLHTQLNVDVTNTCSNDKNKKFGIMCAIKRRDAELNAESKHNRDNTCPQCHYVKSLNGLCECD